MGTVIHNSQFLRLQGGMLMAKLRMFRAGEVIIQENDVGETAYILEQGRVDVTKEQGGKKIYLGYLTAGDIFGEMSIIDDKPRSATVTAAEETFVKEIHRDEFLDILQNDREAAIKILKPLFNRLREANAARLQEVEGGETDLPEFDAIKAAPAQQMRVTLEGITPVAAATLPTNPLVIEQFPFRIGRKSTDPLAHNDLAIPDSIPYQVSRHHVMLVKEQSRVGVLDRGSTLGAALDDVRLGGQGHRPGPLFITGDEGTLVLGISGSPFQYKIRLERL
ncbi:MAG: hypothetical protein Kow0031_24350 [Anaerolineae bacterium]